MTHQLKVLALPESERTYAKAIAEWEREIAIEADYILASSIRHPVCDIRASRRAFDLAKARSLLLDLHPAITSEILQEVHSVLDARAAMVP